MNAYDSMFRIREYFNTGWYDHFRSTYEDALAELLDIMEEIVKERANVNPLHH